ncbi:SDR family NAD(P)-dependent oxidoreductase [Micromonospora sp. NBC_01813]|uniref:SDR family NAD(P)-dependent oxidoreductase n=1 Tax=Micromonospora sp. NBC_01813 TaxID=2975988 RepID=UPI002DD825AB|nr:SDR family NAD(P)-dependent oxidoreductase [Micromonospora sp. NBC_01813]WSA07913.1 SDR family NAD(P)-dependent oxidoreductase [Micromonospora sp. NBC_01813]
MEKKTVIVTGGNAGLGYQCAKSIAERDRNYHVVLACRSLSKGEVAAAVLTEETKNPNISTLRLDLASLSSVRDFCAEFSRAEMPLLHSVVCNAGISAGGVPGQPRTTDGVETIFGVNHLGHFLLTNLLLKHMKPGGRVVFVASDLHNPPRFFPVKVNYGTARSIAARSGPGMQQYCLSKLCNIYCCYEMSRLLSEQPDRQITVNAFNPGAMADTGFIKPAENVIVRFAVQAVGGLMGALIGKQSNSIESGSALAALVTEASYGATTGRYFDRGVEVASSALSYDLGNARDLWETSMELSGLKQEETIFASPGTQSGHRRSGCPQAG